MSKLQTHIDGLWRDTLKGSLTGSVLDEESILIQNQIFYSRSKNPFVFNWVYRFLRGPKEVRAAREKLAEWIADRLPLT